MGKNSPKSRTPVEQSAAGGQPSRRHPSAWRQGFHHRQCKAESSVAAPRGPRCRGCLGNPPRPGREQGAWGKATRVNTASPVATHTGAPCEREPPHRELASPPWDNARKEQCSKAAGANTCILNYSAFTSFVA